MKKTIEMIVPCCNEEECVSLFYDEIKKVFESQLSQYDFEILFVDDGSKDRTLEKIKELAERAGNDKVRYISFSRNFGKESAIYVGLSNSTGDYVVVMDADLQHPPALLPDMLRAIEEDGYDSCAAQRTNRKGEPIVKSFFSKAFYHIMNRMTVIDLVPGGTDYRMMTRQMADAVVSLAERERFTKGIYAWVGFKTKWLPYENIARAAGKSKWSFSSLFNYAGSGIIAFATTPLRSAIWMGMIIVVIAAVYAIYTAAYVLMYPERSTGRATIILIMLFLGGVIITILGMIGEYLARIYMEVKQRPIYIVKESNLEKKEDSEK
ncbi:MAG: glycosyltransferase family 2 protein [Lachnospiraceae bacterium]|nr:glycosyltransferase family 2 protein [Lachnospiraceae bacterium]